MRKRYRYQTAGEIMAASKRQIWKNLFFFPQDVPISKELLHELTEALMLEIKRLQEAE